MEPRGAFPVGSGIAGSSAYGGQKLGDASYFGWPNQAFKALDMHSGACVCWSWGPKWAFMELVRHNG